MIVCSQDSSERAEHNSSDHSLNNYMQEDDIKPAIQSERRCQFCEWKISEIRFLRENLHIRYFDVFNFYFAKPVNEILAQYSLPHVIAFKDYQYLDYENEYLKRYYSINEVSPRLSVLINFFTKSYKPTRPNLIITNGHQAIEKRNFRQARLFLRLLQKNPATSSAVHQEHLRFYTQHNQDDSSESEPSSLRSVQDSSNNQNDEGRNVNNQGDNNPARRNQRNDLPSRVLYSRLSQTTQLSSTHQIPGQGQVEPSLTWERKFFIEMSFSTSTHDIYYPSFTESNQNKNSSSQSRKDLPVSSPSRIGQEFDEEEKKDIEDHREIQTHDGLVDLVVSSGLKASSSVGSGCLKKFTDSVTAQQQEQYDRLLDVHGQHVQRLKQPQYQGLSLNQSSDRVLRNSTQKYVSPIDLDGFDPSKYILGDSADQTPCGNGGFLSDRPSVGQNKQQQKSQQVSKHLPYVQGFERDSQENQNEINLRNGGIIEGEKINGKIRKNNENNYNNSNQHLNFQSNVICQTERDREQIFTESVLPTVSSQDDNNLKHVGSSSSIQQIQKYILAQIKKQHDASNSNNSNTAILNPSLRYLHTSVSPASKSKERKEQLLQQEGLLKKTKQKEHLPQQHLSQLQHGNNNTNQASRKLLSERNFTEINLGSVFEQLRLSNRLASLEAKKNNTSKNNNTSRNHRNAAEKSYLTKQQGQQQTNHSRDNSSKKIKTKQLATKVAKSPLLSARTSPQGFTPRDFTKKTAVPAVGRILGAGELRKNSRHVINSEQSPAPTSARAGRKNSSSTANNNSNNKTNHRSSAQRDGAQSAREEQTCIIGHSERSEERHQVGKVTSSSASKRVQNNNTNGAVVKQQSQASIHETSMNRTNGNNKSTMNSPSRVYTDHTNLRTTISPPQQKSYNNQNSNSKGRTKVDSKRASQPKTNFSPSQDIKDEQQSLQQGQQQLNVPNRSNNSHANQKQNNDYEQYQLRPPELPQQTQQQNQIAQKQQSQQQLQQQQQGHIVGTILTESSDSNSNSQRLHHQTEQPNNHHHSASPPRQNDQLKTNQQLPNNKLKPNIISADKIAPSAGGLSSSRISKQIAQKILTNALTNTINKFYRINLENENNQKEQQMQIAQQQQFKQAHTQSSQLEEQIGQQQAKLQYFNLQNKQLNDNDNNLIDTQQSCLEHTVPTVSNLKNYNTIVQLFEQQQQHNLATTTGGPLISAREKKPEQKKQLASPARKGSNQKIKQRRLSGKSNGKVPTSTASAQVIQSKKKQLQMRQKTSRNTQGNEANSLTGLGLASNQSMNASLNHQNNYSTFNSNNYNNYSSVNPNIQHASMVGLNSQLKQGFANNSTESTSVTKLNTNLTRLAKNTQISQQSQMVSGINTSQNNNSNKLIHNHEGLNVSPPGTIQQQFQQQHQQSLQQQQLLDRQGWISDRQIFQQSQQQSIQDHNKLSGNYLNEQPVAAYGSGLNKLSSNKLSGRNILQHNSSVGQQRMSEPLIQTQGIINSRVKTDNNHNFNSHHVHNHALLTEESQQWLQSYPQQYSNISASTNFNFLANSQNQQTEKALQTQGNFMGENYQSPFVNINQIIAKTTSSIHQSQGKINNYQLQQFGESESDPKESQLQGSQEINIKKQKKDITKVGLSGNKRDDHTTLSHSQQQQQQSSLPSSLTMNDYPASQYKIFPQESDQQRQGFYTQRNLKKSNEQVEKLKQIQQQKCIQSSRGSYQGQYADLSAWKHGAVSQQVLTGPSPPKWQQSNQQYSSQDLLYQQSLNAQHQSQLLLQSYNQQLPVNSPQQGTQSNPVNQQFQLSSKNQVLNHKIKLLSQKTGN